MAQVRFRLKDNDTRMLAALGERGRYAGLNEDAVAKKLMEVELDRLWRSGDYERLLASPTEPPGREKDRGS